MMAKQNEHRRRHRTAILLLLLGSAALPASEVAEIVARTDEPRVNVQGKPGSSVDERVFALEEVSAFALAKQVRAFAAGRQATCSRQPDSGVRAYPALTSDKPIYGSVQFGSLFEERDPALLYYFVIDESGGAGTGYDRLYADLNSDRDLCNDAPVTPMEDPPAGALLRYTSIAKVVCFAVLGIPLSYGSEGTRPLEVMPRLVLLKSGGAMLSFIPTRARQGWIELEGREYDVFLGYNYDVCGWLDHPETAFYLVPREGPQMSTSSVAATTLMVMPRLAETCYRFSATPAGDRLTVRRYHGPMGTFEIGGGRKFKTTDVAASGWLRSRDAVVQMKGPKGQLPTGDYLFDSTTIAHDGLVIALQKNNHSDGGFRSKLYHPPTYPIHIRQDKDFVLDFSNHPEIVFAEPARGRKVKVGEGLSVEAVLVDPVLDFVICDISHTPQAPNSESMARPGDHPAGAGDPTLYPRVTISRANGETVAEGAMRYG